jgi:hypothetical protein
MGVGGTRKCITKYTASALRLLSTYLFQATWTDVCAAEQEDFFKFKGAASC